MIKKIKEWNQTRRRRADMALFMRLYKDPKSTMQGILNEAAYKMAREMFMRMMDAEGFSHCKMCPTRFPLRKLADAMLCVAHYDAAMKSHNDLKKPTPHKEATNGSRNETGTQAETTHSQPYPGTV